MTDTFTFGLVYGTGADRWVEEIDVTASTRSEARRLALAEAERDYEPGWTEVLDLPRGGSGGWVEVR